MIKTSRGRRQWVVPVDDKGHYRGRSRDDKKRAKLREATGAESIQLVDHRTGKPRKIEVLVTKRSKNYALAEQFAAEFERLGKANA